MKMIKRMLSFLLIFSVTAAAVAVAAFAVDDTDETPDLSVKELVDQAQAFQPEPLFDEINIDDDETDGSEIERDNEAPAVTGAASFSPRLSAPSYSNEYYYSDKNVFYKYGWGMPNCTCYAWGRAYEILGMEPQLSVYSAYLWYDYNKENGCYAYGKTPKLGAVACWVYSSGSSGHVAVVEKIHNGIITFSNSAWGGEEFYTSTAPVSDPSNGRSSWIFQGFIYIGEYENNDSLEQENPEGDVYRITSDDGVNFRTGAGTGYQVIGAIGYGTSVTVTKTEKANGYNWGYTCYNGRYGWFVTDYAELVFRRTPSDHTREIKPQERYLMGDADGDGELSVVDATHIQKVLAQIYTPTEYILAVGDYDGDSQLSVIDAVKIQRTLAGIL